MKHQLMKFLRDESGATAIEYGLLASLVALVAAVGFTAVGNSLQGLFTKIGTCLSTGTCPPSTSNPA